MKALERLFAEKLLKVKAVKIRFSRLTRLLGHQVGNRRFIVTIVRRCHILHFVTS